MNTFQAPNASSNSQMDNMKHQTISFIKSGFRIAGYILLIPFSFGFLLVPAIILVASEALGVIEEIGHE
jgi:hypothetical protein